MNHHTFPIDWPPLKTAYKNICPDISGVYKDLGISDAKGKCQVRDGYTYGYCYSLSAELLSTHIDTSETTRAEIIQDGDSRLEVIVSDGQKEIHRQSLLLERGDYECREDGVWVTHPKRAFADGTGYASDRIRVGFLKSEDGALVMQEKGSSFGLGLYIIPVIGSWTQWYRWEPVELGEK